MMIFYCQGKSLQGEKACDKHPNHVQEIHGCRAIDVLEVISDFVPLWREWNRDQMKDRNTSKLKRYMIIFDAGPNESTR